MAYNELIQTIRSFGAFVPEKFYEHFNEENRALGEAIFREHPNDISLSTGGLYLAITLPVNEHWGGLAREHFGRLNDLSPKDAIEMNNKAFSYSTFGFYRDPLDKNKNWKRIVDPFGINGFRAVQPLYEEAIKKDSKLWEPRYNLAQGLLGVWSWGEDPENDDKDYERAFEELTAVLTIDPRNIPARLALAGAFHDYVNPIQLYEDVLDIDPENQEAKEGIGRFQDGIYDSRGDSVIVIWTGFNPGDPSLN